MIFVTWSLETIWGVALGSRFDPPVLNVSGEVQQVIFQDQQSRKFLGSTLENNVGSSGGDSQPETGFNFQLRLTVTKVLLLCILT